MRIARYLQNSVLWTNDNCLTCHNLKISLKRIPVEIDNSFIKSSVHNFPLFSHQISFGQLNFMFAVPSPLFFSVNRVTGRMEKILITIFLILCPANSVLASLPRLRPGKNLWQVFTIILLTLSLLIY